MIKKFTIACECWKLILRILETGEGGGKGIILLTIEIQKGEKNIWLIFSYACRYLLIFFSDINIVSHINVWLPLLDCWNCASLIHNNLNTE